ncbi:MAG: hypothetical protein DMD91_04620 [Candidatus Rokuibacteriota bacterium]|nr:MAG: hypothetical protein DMD91_04620 [Candidatus Rokubacteria bacterium]
MKRVLVVAGAVVVMLTGAVTPAHATTATYSTSSPLDVELRVIDEPTSVSLDQAPPSPNHDRAPRTSMKAATPPSMLLLVGTGLTGLAGMVRRRLARRHRIVW